MRDTKLAKEIRKNPCIVCGRFPVDADHILAFARDKDKDVAENMWPLCRSHHNEKALSLVDFVNKYRLHEELLNRSMWFDGRRWRRHFSTIKA
jgi:hypothetical protein